MQQTERAVQWYDVPAGTKHSYCKGVTCNKPIWWIMNPKTGRMVPIDCDVDGGVKPGPKVDKKQLDAFGPVKEVRGRGVSHFTTCNSVGQFSGTNR